RPAERATPRRRDPERSLRADRRCRPSALLGARRGIRGPRRKVPRMTLVTVDRMLRERARTTPDRVAVEAAGRTWTYAELDARSDELAASLERGSRVSTLTGSSAEHVAVFFACAKAGAILHPLSWRLAPAEIAYQLDNADPAVLLVEDDYRTLAEAALEFASVRPALELPRRTARTREPGPDDPLLLIYTSGTTGKPKGAWLTHA